MMSAALSLAALFGAPAAAMPVNDLIPGAGDFRSQQIRRVKGETDWPFVADRGMLMCAKSLKQPMVYFIPQNAEGEDEYPLALSNDMMMVALVNMGRQSALQPFDSFEQLLKRLFPFVSMGKRLCDQPPGTDLPDSAL